MRLFQNSAIYPSYLKRLNTLARHAVKFGDRRDVFLQDRFGALHFLKPILEGCSDSFFTNGDDQVLQRLWADQNGLPPNSKLEAILLAQIEHHRTEVFYNLDPVRYGSDFVRKLPGSVRRTLCWRAAPSGNADLTAYDAVLGNFPSILETWRAKGCRAELFFPAIDPVMQEYGHGERPIDVLFVGGYSRHHHSRAKILGVVAQKANAWNVVMCLDTSRYTRLSESIAGRFLPLNKYRRPESIAKIAQGPAFGRELYELLGRSKIVLNGAIDMAGTDRGNMRCFEAMGCGSLLVSDVGLYPPGMQPQHNFLAYESSEDCLRLIEDALSNAAIMSTLSERGRLTVKEMYNKDRQWTAFEAVVAKI